MEIFNLKGLVLYITKQADASKEAIFHNHVKLQVIVIRCSTICKSSYNIRKEIYNIFPQNITYHLFVAPKNKTRNNKQAQA